MILYCCADLLWATRIKSAADALALPCRPARDLAMLQARLGDSDVRALIVDLEAPAALALIDHLRGGNEPRPGVRIVAFGPHVSVDHLEAARRAGADAVLARGAFARGLADLLPALAAARPVASDLED